MIAHYLVSKHRNSRELLWRPLSNSFQNEHIAIGSMSEFLRKPFLEMYLVLHKNFFINGYFNKCDQIRSFLWIWSHLLKKSLRENFIFYAV